MGDGPIVRCCTVGPITSALGTRTERLGSDRLVVS
jgi:hypothetical protein